MVSCQRNMLYGVPAYTHGPLLFLTYRNEWQMQLNVSYYFRQMILLGWYLGGM